MAKIALRAYTRNIDSFIDQGQVDEAIAHCKYILKIYPKHIETYKLLGKAYLENQRYSEGSDILQRVLSVIPDDFVSQIGMSIIREDEGNLDAAIWHMERAFEIQPANSVIQEELRRLFGRRDGIQPPKIRLTRGALVRMYIKGELYPQAIAEARAALSEDPNRIDLDVLLARIYHSSGQDVESVDICSKLISKLPYCLEANQILSEILPNTSKKEDAQIYKNRLKELDPYTQFLSDVYLITADIPDNSVTIDELDWQANLDAAPKQPEWASNVGANIQQADEQQTPDWLSNLSAPSPQEGTGSAKPVTTSQSGNEAEIPVKQFEGEIHPAESGAIPEWMRDAEMFNNDASAEKEPSPTFSETPADQAEDALSADLPDWLKPSSSPVNDEGISSPVENVPAPWLKETELNPVDSSSIANQPEPQTSSIPETNPENMNQDESFSWLENLARRQGASEETLISTPPAVPAEDVKPEEPAAEGPAVPTAEPVFSSDEDLSSWLKSLDQGEKEIPPFQTPTNEEPVKDDSNAEWLQGLVQPVDEPTTPSAAINLDQTDLPSWMQDDSAQSQPSDSTSAFPEADLPDWLLNPSEQTENAAENSINQPVAATTDAVEEPMTPVFDEVTSPEATTITAPEIANPIPENVEAETQIPSTMPEQIPDTLEPAVSEFDHIQDETVSEPEPQTMQVEPPVSQITQPEPDLTAETQDVSVPEPELTPPAQTTAVPQPDLPSAAQPLAAPEPELEPVIPTAPIPQPVLKQVVETLLLDQAHDAMKNRDIDSAVEKYTAMINNGQDLDKVILDLNNALYNYPVDTSLWQTLGDAHAKNGNLSEALSAYTKAEELLR